MQFNPPHAVPRTPGDPSSLWRRLFMSALDGYPPSDEAVRHALHTAALLSDSPLMIVVDTLVDLGLRADREAMPEPWLIRQRGRVLDVAEREMLSFGQASLAASWGWMPPPPPRLYLPHELCPEADPFGADLLTLLGEALGPMPRFGYRPATVRLALLRMALGMGRPLAEIVTALAARGVVLPPEAVPAGCREHLRLTATHPLMLELLASWQASQRTAADVIPLRRVR